MRSRFGKGSPWPATVSAVAGGPADTQHRSRWWPGAVASDTGCYASPMPDVTNPAGCRTAVTRAASC